MPFAIATPAYATPGTSGNSQQAAAAQQKLERELKKTQSDLATVIAGYKVLQAEHAELKSQLAAATPAVVYTPAPVAPTEVQRMIEAAQAAQPLTGAQLLAKLPGHYPNQLRAAAARGDVAAAQKLQAMNGGGR
jgi:hypothetical protein